MSIKTKKTNKNGQTSLSTSETKTMSATEKAFELADAVMVTESGTDNLRAFLAMKPAKDSWRGIAAVPAGSILEIVLSAFREGTDIPLELPFITTLSLMSGVLLGEGVRIDIGGSLIAPTMMTVVLGASGIGKTFTQQTLTRNLNGKVREFPEAASAARFAELLQTHNNSLWIRDEFGQLLLALQEQPHMAELKDYVLRSYDGLKIERQTKKDRIIIHEPALSILGLTVLDTFRSQVPPASLVDGFAQRFQYIIAKPDSERRMEDFALYDLSHHYPLIGAAWDKMNAIPLHPVYKVTTGAVDAYRRAFKMMRAANEELPPSFFRRSMFAAVRYALLYHVMLGKPTAEIDEADIAWGARLVSLHMNDARELLLDHGLSDLERLVQRVEEICEEARQNGKKVTKRELIRRMNAVDSVRQAEQLLSLVQR